MQELESSVDLPELAPQLAALVLEAGKLRKLEPPDVGDGPSRLHQQLVWARAALDRVEEIVAQLIALHGRVRHAVLSARHDLEEAENKAYGSRAVSFDQFDTGRQRSAWVGQRTLAERERAHRVDLLENDVSAALEEVKLVRWGIDGVRRDVQTRVQIMSIERSIER
jgi:hypothetical protein